MKYFIFKLRRYFSSGWSKWIDINYIVKYDHFAMGELVLLQMKVNSKNGKRKFKLSHIFYSRDEILLKEIARNINPKLLIRNK